MLRGYLEKIMGLATGSDGNVQHKMVQDLLEGFVGEGLIDKRVQVVKTHFPEKKSHIESAIERVVLVTRNPMDTLVSLFNMIATGTHNESIIDSDFELFKPEWEDIIKQEMTVWKDFYHFWLSKDIPVHILKYEDLKQSPYHFLKQVLEFLLEVPDITDTKVHKYLKLAVIEGPP